jgi:hypothetical protein
LPQSHSSFFDHRRRPDTFFIAIANAKSTPNQKNRNRPQSRVLDGIPGVSDNSHPQQPPAITIIFWRSAARAYRMR